MQFNAVLCCAVQYKEAETLMKSLKEERDAAQRTCDQQGQHILSLEANLSAADEKRRRLRKDLAEVSYCLAAAMP